MHLEVRIWNLLYHSGNKPNTYIKIHLYIRFSICSTKIDFLLPHNDFTLVPPSFHLYANFCIYKDASEQDTIYLCKDRYLYISMVLS